MSEPKRLMLILSDRLTEFMQKVVTDRRYNPGNMFDEVHIVMTNDDRCDAAAVQRMVGDAKLFLYNLPAGSRFFAATLGWRPWLLGPWTRRAVDLARRIRPNLVSALGSELNAYAALAIKREIGVPYIVRLRTEPERATRSGIGGWKATLIGYASAAIERRALRGADMVLVSYSSIIPFVERLGVKRHRIAFNVVNPAHIVVKSDYRIGPTLRILCVGRQIPGKNPEHIIRAVARDPARRLTVIGNGPFHARLVRLAEELGAQGQIEFRTRVANDELCEMLPSFDIFAGHSDYWEIPQTVQEAMLAGLPAVVNREHCGPGTELDDSVCLLVANSAAGYDEAFSRLTKDAELRTKLGQAGLQRAQLWAPARAEAAIADAYRELI